MEDSKFIEWAQEEVNAIRMTQTYKWLSRRYGDAVALDALRVFLEDYEEEKRTNDKNLPV